MEEPTKKPKTILHDYVHLILDGLEYAKQLIITAHNFPFKIAKKIIIEPLNKVIWKPLALPLIKKFIIKPMIIPLMINASKSENRYIRAIAASALGDMAEIDPKNQKIVQALTNALSDKEHMVAGNAVRSLGGIPQPKAVTALLTVINVRKEFVGIEATDALAEIGNVDLQLIKDGLPGFAEIHHNSKQGKRVAAEKYVEICKKIQEKKQRLDMPGELLNARIKPPKGRTFRRRVAHA